MSNEKIYYEVVSVNDRLPEEANENYMTISEKGFETSRFFNGNRFEMANYEGPITHWLEKKTADQQTSDLQKRIKELEDVKLAHQECFEKFIPTDKWDEATLFLSTYNNGLAKDLSNRER